LKHRPQAVVDLHQAYCAAGAQVHTANTFRCHERNAGPSWRALVQVAVELAQVGGGRVAGSMAPLQDCYRPDLSPLNPGPEHLALAQALVEEGVDLLLVETHPHLSEALAATTAARSCISQVWSALTPGYDNSLMSPCQLADGARSLGDAGAEVVLVNCLPAAYALPYARALAETGLPWGIYANAGKPEDGLGWGDPRGPERYAEHATSWRDLGAQVIGGCCGTGPAHIAALRKHLEASITPSVRQDDP
jgi:S-methylmethionine-dependent homocysteine/selenocysteine methylase